MQDIINLESPNFELAARFNDLIEQIRNQPQDPKLTHEAAVAWIEEGQYQLMRAIEDHYDSLVNALKHRPLSLPIWLIDPNQELHIRMPGPPPALTKYRETMMTHFSRLLAKWGFNARVTLCSYALQGETGFQISIKLPTLSEHEGPSHIPIIVGNYFPHKNRLCGGDKSPAAPRLDHIPHHPHISLDDFVSTNSLESDVLPPVADLNLVPSEVDNLGSSFFADMDLRPGSNPRTPKREAKGRRGRHKNSDPDSTQETSSGARYMNGNLISGSPRPRSAHPPLQVGSSALDKDDRSVDGHLCSMPTAINTGVADPSPRRLYLESSAWPGEPTQPPALNYIKYAAPGNLAVNERPNADIPDQPSLGRDLIRRPGWRIPKTNYFHIALGLTSISLLAMLLSFWTRAGIIPNGLSVHPYQQL